MIKILFSLVAVIVIAFGAYNFYFDKNISTSQQNNNQVINSVAVVEQITPTPIPLPPTPETKILENNYHIYQTFNNCGPAALSMTLSYYGIKKTQLELGLELRPYQNPQGINDDKSVTMSELAQKAKEFDLIPFHRPNGTIEIIKQFIAIDLPIIARTRSTENDDIGHFRVVKGYDDVSEKFFQDDSLQGHNLRYTFTKFNNLWKMFNYEYLVLVPKEKVQLAERILGDDNNETKAWTKAAAAARLELSKNEYDIYSRLNLSVALYHIKDFQSSINEYEKVESKLPFRTLWYQIEPILAYFELGDYDKVLSLSTKILNNQNRAYSELYILRGEIFMKQGNLTAAKQEYEKALFYNTNMKSAQLLLESVN